MSCCENFDNGKREVRFLTGLVFVVAGVLFLMKNLGWLPSFIEDLFFTWQMLLIAIGIIRLASPRSRGFAIFLIAVGVFFLLPKLFIVPLFFSSTFWPVIIIVVGVAFLFFSNSEKRIDY